MYQRILVPVDDSAASQRGLREAIGLALDQRATLHLVHVIDSFMPMVDPAFWPNLIDLNRGLTDSAEALLAQAAAEAKQAGVATDTEVRETLDNRAASAIVAAARDAGCDLIVMGTHGRRGASHLVLGSDAEAVLKTSPVPVLLVRTPEGSSR
jgi:nucleotide-binding universal stress UspA family protein